MQTMNSHPTDAEVTATSLKGLCPNCQAKPGQPCTAPSSTGRNAIKTIHYGRYEAGAAAMVAAATYDTARGR